MNTAHICGYMSRIGGLHEPKRKSMNIEKFIIEYIKNNPDSSSNDILNGIDEKKSIATVKRVLSKLVQEKLVIFLGKGKATRYQLSPFYALFEQIDVDK